MTEIFIFRDPDFSIIMTYLFSYEELEFLPRQICQGFVTVGDDEHDELETFVLAQE